MWRFWRKPPPPDDLVSFSPHATPPAGSRGDSFDGQLAAIASLAQRERPNPLLSSPADPEAPHAAIRRETEGFFLRAFTPPTHPSALLAWILTGVALAATGPLRDIAAPLAVASLLLARLTVKTVEATPLAFTGIRAARLAAMTNAVILVGCLALGPGPYTSAAIEQIPGGTHLIGLHKGFDGWLRAGSPEKARRGDRDFNIRQHFGEAATTVATVVRACGKDQAIVPYYRDEEGKAPPDGFGTGRFTVDLNNACVRETLLRSRADLADLALRVRRDGVRTTRADFLDFVVDPWSPDTNWPLAVVVIGDYGIVWSAGPDGIPQTLPEALLADPRMAAELAFEGEPSDDVFMIFSLVEGTNPVQDPAP